MADLKQTNWADDEDFDSDEGEGDFGLEEAQRQNKKKLQQEKVSSMATPQLCCSITNYFCISAFTNPFWL
jgi:hypothetical protein